MDKTNIFVSRAGEKLAHALKEFNLQIKGKVCADLGSSTGGFVDCLLQAGAKKVYAVEKGYGVLDWKLRNDSRVVVMERANALFVELPELVDLVSVDTSWTRQEKIIPKALSLLKSDGIIVSLVKPHYEAQKNQLQKGMVPEVFHEEILLEVKNKLEKIGAKIIASALSPVEGKKGGNKEWLFLIEEK